MASERPSIIQVRNDVVRIALPYVEDSPTTWITSAVAASGVTLAVKDNAGLSQNDYLIIGAPGSQQTEIVRITAAVIAGTALTVSALTFPHPVNTKVALIRYNQVLLYGASTSDSASPTLIGSAVNIDVKNGLNEIKASTTYSYYYARYSNVQASTFSAYSDAAAATGLSARARGEMKREFLSIYNEIIDTLVTDDWLNRAINRWQREVVTRRTRWSALYKSAIIETVQDTQTYDLPSDITDGGEGEDVIVSAKYYNQPPMAYRDHDVFLNQMFDYIGTTLSADVAVVDVTISLTDASDFPTSGTIHIQGDEITYTGKSGNTLTGVTGITATHTSGDEVWSTYTTGIPVMFTAREGALLLNPIPGASEAGHNIYLDYWGTYSDLSDDQDETVFHFPENCYLYLNWQVSLRRKLPLKEQQDRRLIWQDDLDARVADDPDVQDICIQPVNYYTNPY